MTDPQNYFAAAATGIEALTAAELNRLGAAAVRPVIGGVHFSGDLELFYRASLWLRTATRILRPLREFAAGTPEMLYSQTRRVPWENFLNPSKTFSVHATIAGGSARRKAPPGEADDPAERRIEGHSAAGGDPSRSGRRAGSERGILNSQYAALKIKDALVDRLRHEQGARPDVDRENPDLRVHAHFAGGRCTLSLDGSGASLHERGYRVQTTAAPLKETLAAAIVELTRWDGESPLIDPMCGSGTLVIEAAMKALRVAPGLLRNTFGFEGWPDFDAALWEQVKQAARSEQLSTSAAYLQATDQDSRAVEAAKTNANRAGVAHAIRFGCQRAEEMTPPISVPGVIVVNPPYGNRLGDEAVLSLLYRRLGETWTRNFAGWTAFVLAGNLPLARDFGLAASEKFKLFNGPLECRLLKFELPPISAGTR